MRRAIAALLGVATVGAACSAGGAETSDVTTDATTSVSVATTSVPSITVPSTVTTTPVTPGARATELCERGIAVVDGTVRNRNLVEASGLVASRTHPGVLWSHNDGGGAPALFAVGRDGEDLGVHPLPIGGVVDVEDVALQSGVDDDFVLLADIGDNRQRRTTIRLYRFAEPDPTDPGPLVGVEVLEFAYPDRAHNAEVLLVDDESDSAVIVTKEQEAVDGVPNDFGPTAPSFVFEGPLSGHGSGPVVLDLVATIDMPDLATRTVSEVPHPATVLGVGGVPTGGDVSADGTLVALRTYETVWLWARSPGRRVAEVFAETPCQVPMASERQGEALAFDGDDLVSIGEGAAPPVNRVAP